VTLTADWLAAIDGTNTLTATIEFSRHGLVQHIDPVDAARVAFEDADPVREFPSWPGKRNFEGKLWMASTGQHVPFESFWERAFLTSMDRTGDAVGVSSQPMWIRWRSPKRSHAPDYFVRRSDGTALLTDVRPAELIKPEDSTKFETQPNALPVAEFRKSVKIPQSVFYKTLSHARSESAAALHPRSRAPKQPATRYGPDVVNELSGSASSASVGDG